MEFLAFTTILFVISFLLGAYIRRLQIHVALHPYTQDDVDNARKDSLKQSRATVSGKVQEHLAPMFPEFGDYNLKDARFLGSPIDFVIFDGLDSGNDVKVVFLEVKTGNSQLTTRERKVRDAIQAGHVAWSLVRLKQTVDKAVETVVA